MSKRMLILLLAPLIVICAAQSLYIYQARQARQRMLDPWAGLDQWIADTNRNLLAGTPVPFGTFDRLFDDRFFNSGFDPFRAIKGFSDQFDSLIPAQNRSLFRNSLEGWYHSRMDVTSINPEIKSTQDQVVVSLKIPHLQSQSLNVNVEQNRIRLNYHITNVEEKKDEKGNIIQHAESEQQVEKIMPVPAEAEPGSAQIVKNEDNVQIIFKRKQTKD